MNTIEPGNLVELELATVPFHKIGPKGSLLYDPVKGGVQQKSTVGLIVASMSQHGRIANGEGFDPIDAHYIVFPSHMGWVLSNRFHAL